jgi:hypothetical protein
LDLSPAKTSLSGSTNNLSRKDPHIGVKEVEPPLPSSNTSSLSLPFLSYHQFGEPATQTDKREQRGWIAKKYRPVILEI